MRKVYLFVILSCNRLKNLIRTEGWKTQKNKKNLPHHPIKRKSSIILLFNTQISLYEEQIKNTSILGRLMYDISENWFHFFRYEIQVVAQQEESN